MQSVPGQSSRVKIQDSSFSCTSVEEEGKNKFCDIENSNHIHTTNPCIPRSLRNAEVANIYLSPHWMGSMDGYEVYNTVATYGKSYVHFLSDEPLKDSTSSTIMLEHGSFDLGLSKTSETYAD